MPANLKNSVVATGLEKGNFHSSLKEGQCQRMFKLHSNYHTIALISHGTKVMFKILQARLQQYVNWELTDVQVESLYVEKAEEPEIILLTPIGS